MKALKGTLRKGALGKVKCWELKSHLFKAFSASYFHVWHQILGTKLENSHWKVFEKRMKMHMISHIKVHFSTTYHILLPNLLPLKLYAIKVTMGFQHWLAHLSPSWLVN